jgi:AraC-like DNA-binding protein
MPTPRRTRPAAPPGLVPASPLVIQRYEWMDRIGTWQTTAFTWAGIVLAGGVRIRPAIGASRDLAPGDAYLVPAGCEILLISAPKAVDMRILADAGHAAGCFDRIAAAGGPRLGQGIEVLGPGAEFDREGWAARAAQPVPPWQAEAFWWSLAAACHARGMRPIPHQPPPAWLAAAVAGCDSGHGLRDGTAALVRQSGRSAAHVNRTVRACYGCTATDLVNRLRLAAAERLLAASDLDTTTVAARVGFANRAHFHRLFAAAHAGTGPGAWRRRR